MNLILFIHGGSQSHIVTMDVTITAVVNYLSCHAHWESVPRYLIVPHELKKALGRLTFKKQCLDEDYFKTYQPMFTSSRPFRNINWSSIFKLATPITCSYLPTEKNNSTEKTRLKFQATV